MQRCDLTLKHLQTLLPVGAHASANVAASAITGWYLGKMAFIAPSPTLGALEPLYPHDSFLDTLRARCRLENPTHSTSSKITWDLDLVIIICSQIHSADFWACFLVLVLSKYLEILEPEP